MVKGEATLWTRCLALQMGGSAWSAPFLERWKRIARELVRLHLFCLSEVGVTPYAVLLPPVLMCGNFSYWTLKVTQKLEMDSTVEIDTFLCLS